MNTNVETQGFDLTPALKAWVNNELQMTLDRFNDDIRRVEVNMLNAKGPAGGKGKAAGITVFLKHRSPIRVATINTDLYAAVAISAMRAEKAVDKALSKRRRWQRTQIRLFNAQAVSAPI